MTTSEATPAEPAEAEELIRDGLENGGVLDLSLLVPVMAEYDERGRKMAKLQAEVEQLRAERDAWEQRMADLRAEFVKIDDVRERDRERLREERDRLHARVVELEEARIAARRILDGSRPPFNEVREGDR